MNGSVYRDISLTFPGGEKLVAGRLLTGNADVLRATDLGMDQIKSLVLQSGGRTPVGSVEAARLVHVEGSLGSVTSKGSSNYASIRAWSLDSYVSAAGTMGLGTLQGSVRILFQALGQ